MEAVTKCRRVSLAFMRIRYGTAGGIGKIAGQLHRVNGIKFEKLTSHLVGSKWRAAEKLTSILLISGGGLKPAAS